MAARQNSVPPAPLPTPIAIGLARASTDRQEHSVSDQEAEIRRWCEQHHHQLVQVFPDDGVSGSVLDRPALLNLLNFVEQHPQKGVVVVWRRNRLARPEDPRDGLLLERRIERAGWRLVYLQGAQQSGNVLVDTLMATIEHHQSGEFLRTLSGDILRGQLRRMLEGKIVMGQPPYGYDREATWPNGTVQVIPRRTLQSAKGASKVRLVPGDSREVETVRWIFERYADGGAGGGVIIAELNERGRPTPTPGRPWTRATIREILRNPVYTGDLVWNREHKGKFMRLSGQQATSCGQKNHRGFNAEEEWIRLPGQHAALISRELWDRTRRLTAARAEVKGGARLPVATYSLRGLLWCGCCGDRMSGASRPRPAGGHYSYYTCAGYVKHRSCRPFTVSKAGIEHAVLTKLQEAFAAHVGTPNFRERVLAVLRKRLVTDGPADEDARARRELADLTAKIDRAVENMGEVGAAFARQIAAKVEGWAARQKELEETLARLSERKKVEEDIEQAADDTVALLQELAEASDETPPAQLNRLLSRCVERVDLTFEAGKVSPGAHKPSRHRFVGGEVAVAEGLASIRVVVAGPGGVRMAPTQDPRPQPSPTTKGLARGALSSPAWTWARSTPAPRAPRTPRTSSSSWSGPARAGSRSTWATRPGWARRTACSRRPTA